MSIFDAIRIAIPEGVLHQPMDGDTVLLELGSETYYGLDEVGTRVWQLLQEHGTAEPIVDALVVEYEVDEASVRRDLERLLGELAEAGLIEVERPGQ